MYFLLNMLFCICDIVIELFNCVLLYLFLCVFMLCNLMLLAAVANTLQKK